jgi:FxsC-like protein
VTRLQASADFGEEYAKEGMQLLCRVNKYKDLYEEICTKIANRVIDATEHVIPDDPVPTDIAAIPDLALPGAPPGRQKLAPERGPRRVQFILAAASQDELEGVREKLDAYGESGADWCPYLPPNRRSIGPVLQQLAAQEDCTSEVVTTVDGLVARLKKALEQKNMVIIVVDPWTLQLGTYAKALQDYDELDLLHCAVVVPWNETDPETTSAREDLHALLKETLVNKVLAKDPKRFRSDVSSPEQLEANVRDLLVELRQRILERMDVVRKIKAERVIPKPGISAVRT